MPTSIQPLNVYFSLFICLLFACKQSKPPSTQYIEQVRDVSKNEDIVVELENLPDSILPEVIEVAVSYDPSIQAPNRYKAYPFKPILDHLVQQYELDTLTTQVVFECKDGYAPTNRLTDLYAAGGGYLAFQDLSAEGEALWPASKMDRYPPFFLVWTETEKEKRKLAWPYGLVRLKFLTDDPYESLYPTENPALASGFENYKLHCIKCHSLNKIGGIMGPEFNVPKNLTEYWSRENIIAFAKNPQAFRYNSKMHPIRSLDENELHVIVDYLEYMSTFKIELP